MAYNFTEFKKRIDEITLWLQKELSAIRTGQATTALLDGVRVDSYGTKTPLNQVANITTEDPKTIRITPWDGSLTQAIEKAIMVADLGVSTAVSDAGVRVIFPELTTERRQLFVKNAKGKVEEARISVRNERNDVSSDIQKQQKDGELSEDDAKRDKEEMQKIVDAANKKFDSFLEQKEKEILS